MQKRQYLNIGVFVKKYLHCKKCFLFCLQCGKSAKKSDIEAILEPSSLNLFEKIGDWFLLHLVIIGYILAPKSLIILLKNHYHYHWFQLLWLTALKHCVKLILKIITFASRLFGNNNFFDRLELFYYKQMQLTIKILSTNFRKSMNPFYLEFCHCFNGKKWKLIPDNCPLFYWLAVKQSFFPNFKPMYKPIKNFDCSSNYLLLQCCEI